MIDDAVQKEIISLLEYEYKLAKQTYLDAEVFRYQRMQLALIEFEAAFSHVTNAILPGNNPSFEIESARSHLRRLAVEVREELCEDLLLRIRRRIDPSINRVWLCRLLCIPPTRLDNRTVEALNGIKQQIAEGRTLKGAGSTFAESYGCFQDAWDQLLEIDSQIPDTAFMQRIFSIILLSVGLAVGLFFRWLIF